MLKTENLDLTNSVIKVKKAIVAILFMEAPEAIAGDAFLSRLGIDLRRETAADEWNVAPKGAFVDFADTEIKRGGEFPGFDIDALTGIRNMLNLDH